jgi:hypothetical protein
MMLMATGARPLNGTTLTVMAAVVIAVGVVALLQSLWYWQRAIASLRWPRAIAQVTQAKVTRYSRGAGPRWHWEFEYVYCVAGRTYKSNRPYFGMAPTLKVARKVASRYPVGSTINIRHHPSKPQLSTLLAGSNRHTWYTLLAAPALWSLAWFLLMLRP